MMIKIDMSLERWIKKMTGHVQVMNVRFGELGISNGLSQMVPLGREMCALLSACIYGVLVFRSLRRPLHLETRL